MTSFPKILLIFISVALLSCGQEKKEPPKEKWEVRYDKQKQLDTLNKTEANNLTLKLNAISGKDSSLKFTYQLQEIVQKGNQQISFIGNITDITKVDSNYVLKIYGTFAKQDCFGEISVSPDIFKKLYTQFDLKSSIRKGCFIFKPKSIKSSSLLTIDSEVSGGETIDDATTDLTYDFNDVILFLKGNLIDYYMYKRLPKDED